MQNYYGWQEMGLPTLMQDDFQIQIKVIVTVLIIFEACMNVLFIVKVKISMLIN